VKPRTEAPRSPRCAAYGSYSCRVVSGAVTESQPPAAASPSVQATATVPVTAARAIRLPASRDATAGPAATTPHPISAGTASAAPARHRQCPMSGAARSDTPDPATATVPHTTATITSPDHAATGTTVSHRVVRPTRALSASTTRTVRAPPPRTVPPGPMFRAP
jgi:hypothetical protein